MAIEKNEARFGGEEVRKVGVPLRKNLHDVVFELERYDHRDRQLLCHYRLQVVACDLGSKH